jgi:hypothetical protein
MMALSFIAVWAMNSCSSVGNTGYLYQTAGAAHDHMMLVRENPPTFGYERLSALSQYYPDLAEFIKRERLPRYYAETSSGGSRYLILYYPKRSEAFACRSLSKLSHQIEFSGPYPITKNELETLGELEADIAQDFSP